MFVVVVSLDQINHEKNIFLNDFLSVALLLLFIFIL